MPGPEINPGILPLDGLNISAQSGINSGNVTNSSYVGNFPRFGCDLNFANLRGNIYVSHSRNSQLLANDYLSNLSSSYALEVVSYDGSANTVTMRVRYGGETSNSITVPFIRPFLRTQDGSYYNTTETPNSENFTKGRSLNGTSTVIGGSLEGYVMGDSGVNIRFSYGGLTSNPNVSIPASEYYKKTYFTWNKRPCTLENFLGNSVPRYSVTYYNNWDYPLGTLSNVEMTVSQGGTCTLLIRINGVDVTDQSEVMTYYWNSDLQSVPTVDVSAALHFVNGQYEETVTVPKNIAPISVNTGVSATYTVSTTFTSSKLGAVTADSKSSYEAHFTVKGEPDEIIDTTTTGGSDSNRWLDDKIVIPSSVTINYQFKGSGAGTNTIKGYYNADKTQQFSTALTYSDVGYSQAGENDCYILIEHDNGLGYTSQVYVKYTLNLLDKSGYSLKIYQNGADKTNAFSPIQNYYWDSNDISYYQTHNNKLPLDYTGITAKIINSEDANFNQTVTVNDSSVAYDGSVSSATIKITVTGTYNDKNFTAYYYIHGEPLSYVRLVSTGTNTTPYYDVEKPFAAPEGVTWIAYFNDPDEDPEQFNGSPEYYYDEGFTQKLVVDENVTFSPNKTEIYVKDPVSGATGSFGITVTHVQITSVTFLFDGGLMLGKTFSDYMDQVSAVANYNDDTHKTLPKTKFTFIGGGNRCLEPTDIAWRTTIGVAAEELSGTISKNSITWDTPEIDEENTTLKLNGASVAYSNDVSTVNLTPIQMDVYYAGTNGYHKLVPFSSLVITSSIDLNGSGDDSVFAFDGTSVIHIVFGGSALEESGLFSITATNEFDPNDSVTKTQKFDVYGISNITGISIEQNPFTKYHTGDMFLENSEDDTKVTVWYRDVEDTPRYLTFKLKDGLPMINVSPIKGTYFSRAASAMTVTVKAANNTSISDSYTISVSPEYSYDDTNTVALRAVKTTAGISIPAQEQRESLTLPSGTFLLVDEDDTDQGENGRVLRSGSFADELSIDQEGHYKSGTIRVYGYLTNVGNPAVASHVVLFEDYIQPVTGESNMTVEFPSYATFTVLNNGVRETHPMSDYVNLCQFGHLFGNNNAKNRLFLSGNPLFPNFDWHSGPVNESKQEGEAVNSDGDFSYFEDTSYCQYGQTDNAIMGYDIISNDRMAVIKSRSDREPTLYYRTSTLVTATNGSGTVAQGLEGTLYEEAFPRVIGNNSGPGAMNRDCVVNFNGDTLFISSEGSINGLDIVGEVGDMQRCSSSRSLFIDPRLEKKGADKVFLWTDNDFLYAVFPDEIYVANRDMISSDTKQYEWWKMDVKNVSAITRIGDATYYGTTDGKMFLFGNGKYADEHKNYVVSNVIQIDPNGNVCNASSSLLKTFDLSCKHTFASGKTVDSAVFIRCGVISTTDEAGTDILLEDGVFKIVAIGNDGGTDDQRLSWLLTQIDDGKRYFLNHSEKVDANTYIHSAQGSIYSKEQLTQLLYGVSFEVNFIEGTDNFTVSNFREEIQKPNHLSDAEYLLLINEVGLAGLAKMMTDECIMCSKDGGPLSESDAENGEFALSDGFKGDDGKYKVLDLTNYGIGNPHPTVSAVLTEHRPVKAYYITAPFTMGDLMHNKTIWAWTVTNDTSMESHLEVSHVSNDVQIDDMARITANSGFEAVTSEIARKGEGVDFASMDMSFVDFDKVVVPYKYTFYRPLFVPFICFGLRSNEAENSVLSALQILYSIPSASFGNR